MPAAEGPAMAERQRFAAWSAAGFLLLATSCEPGEVDPPANVTTFHPHLTADNGIVLENGLNLPNGSKLRNSIRLMNGLNLANGIQVENGLVLSNSIRLMNGVLGPAIRPPSGSDLELWIDSNPNNNLRILRYEIECALPPGTVVSASYRGYEYGHWYGVANLGPSLARGLMTEDDQEQVSSCLLARVNASGQGVMVDMLGPMTGFSTNTASDASYYSLVEAAVWGNLFASPPIAYVSSAIGTPCSTRACDAGPQGCLYNLSTQSCGPTLLYVWWTTNLRWVPEVGYVSSVTDPATGRVWHHPITTYLHERGPGEACTFNEECLSQVCNGASYTCD
jgi:hypothetical protein